MIAIHRGEISEDDSYSNSQSKTNGKNWKPERLCRIFLFKARVDRTIRSFHDNISELFAPIYLGLSREEEWIVMSPRSKFRTEVKISWEESLEFYRDQLRSYLGYLIQCNCAEEILTKVDAEVKDATVPDNFRLRFMVRIMVRKAIDHMRECNDPSGKPLSTTTDLSLKTIPVQERLVYFLRDILEYSKRDTSLLIGISDVQVDELLSLARKRIDMLEGPSSLEIQNPSGTYFRWKFVNLQLPSISED